MLIFKIEIPNKWEMPLFWKIARKSWFIANESPKKIAFANAADFFERLLSNLFLSKNFYHFHWFIYQLIALIRQIGFYAAQHLLYGQCQRKLLPWHDAGTLRRARKPLSGSLQPGIRFGPLWYPANSASKWASRFSLWIGQMPPVQRHFHSRRHHPHTCVR